MRVSIKVATKSKQNRVVKISNTEYKVYVTVAPERGKANEKVVELLADYFDVSKSGTRIVKGETNNKKIVEIESTLSR